MYTNLINTELKNSSAEIKWFLLALLYNFYSKGKVELTVKDLSERLGVSKNVITKSFSYLVEVKALNKRKLKTDKNGFVNTYDILIDKTSIDNIFPSMKKNEFPQINDTHKSLVDMMFKTKSNELHKSKLQISNRLLLVILLMHADNCGVVRGLGVSDLMRLTGMSRDRLKSQLNKLKYCEFMCASLGGVTGRYLFGVAKGIYRLNLKHKFYQTNAYKPITVLIPNREGDYENVRFIYSQARFTNRALKNIRTDKNNRDNSNKIKEEFILKFLDRFSFDVKASLPNELDSNIRLFFQDSDLSRVPKYLQLKINDYACVLLNFDTCTNSKQESCILKEMIKNDLFPSQLTFLNNSEISGIYELNKLKDMFTNYIFTNSLMIRENIVNELELIPDLQLDDVKYLFINPDTKYQSDIVLEIYPQQCTCTNSHLYRYDPNKSSYIKADYKCFPIEEQYSCGLLTDPKLLK